jgi:2-methylcitrate dehydratase PrpD
VFGITPKPAALIENLGASPKLQEVSFKPWCAARQTMAATQALHEIIDSGVVAADITAIEVSVPPPFLKMVDHGIVGGRIARLTSQPYQMAIAAVARDLAYDVGQMGDVPADVLRLMNKITVRPNDDLLDGFPRQWGAGLHVRTTNSEHQRLIRNIPGDPERPSDESAIKTKAFRLFGSTADNLVGQCRSMFEGRTTPEQLIDFVDSSCAAAGGDAR